MTLASVKEVAVGKDLYVVSRINGKVYCVSGKCTHYGAPLVKGVETEGRLVCPWHGASFDIVTVCASSVRMSRCTLTFLV